MPADAMSNKRNGFSKSLTDVTIFKAYSVKYAKYLKRLPKKTIIDFALEWLDNPLMEPHLIWDDYQISGYDTEQDGKPVNKRTIGLDMLKAEYNELYNSTITKKELIERLLLDHWSQGLNMLQIAHIDTSVILTTNNSQLWTYSTLLQNGKDYVPVNFKSVIKYLQESIYPLFLNHVSISEHNELRLTFIRIQIFEAKSVSALLSSSTIDKYNAASPIYLALPESSPYIIHSHLSATNPYLKGIFQTIIKLLFRPGRPVEIKHSESIPTKSISSLSVLKGAYRKANVQGPWKIYSNGEADSYNSPLEPESTQKALKRKQEFDFEDELRTCKRPLPEPILKKLTNLRFHGDIEPSYSVDNQVQISYNSFMLKVPYKDSQGSETFVPSINIELQGTDIFGGVKELALKRAIDIEKMPSWLTGENGVNSGTITADGQFQKRLPSTTL